MPGLFPLKGAVSSRRCQRGSRAVIVRTPEGNNTNTGPPKKAEVTFGKPTVTFVAMLIALLLLLEAILLIVEKRSNSATASILTA